MAVDTPISDILDKTCTAPAREVERVLREVRRLIVGGYSPHDFSFSEGVRPASMADVEPERRCFTLERGSLRVHVGGHWCFAESNDEALRYVSLRDAFWIAQAPGREGVRGVIVAEAQLSLQVDPSSLCVPLRMFTLPLNELVTYLDRAIVRVSSIVKRRS